MSTSPRERPLLAYSNELGPMLYDIDLEVVLASADAAEMIVSRTNFREMYCSSGQQIVHHAIGGCRMETGDLIGSGTISGSTQGGQGSLLELTKGGRSPIELADGTRRNFIEDGDTIALRGRVRGDGYLVGFGACSGRSYRHPNRRAELSAAFGR